MRTKAIARSSTSRAERPTNLIVVDRPGAFHSPLGEVRIRARPGAPPGAPARRRAHPEGFDAVGRADVDAPARALGPRGLDLARTGLVGRMDRTAPCTPQIGHGPAPRPRPWSAATRGIR